MQLASMKGSMCSMRACVLLMINWLTQAMAWDLQHNNASHRSYASSTFHSHAAHSECRPLSCLPACVAYRSEEDSSSVNRRMRALRGFGSSRSGDTTRGPCATLWPRRQIIQTSDVTETNPADWCGTAGINSQATQKCKMGFKETVKMLLQEVWLIFFFYTSKGKTSSTWKQHWWNWTLVSVASTHKRLKK